MRIRPEDWDSTEPMGAGQIDFVAKEIARQIRDELPPTLEEAVRTFGPLQITHVSNCCAEANALVQTTFLTAFSKKPEVFFAGTEYQIPYFRQWIESVWSQMVKLDEPIDVDPFDMKWAVWTTEDGDVVLGDRRDPFNNPLTVIWKKNH